MRRSANLPSPFVVPCGVDDDLRFSARCIAIFGPSIKRWRRIQSRALTLVAKALAPLDALLVALMPPTVRSVAHTKRPAAIAAMTILLRWPDREQPARYVTGFQTAGSIDSSNLFRALPAVGPSTAEEPDPLESLWGSLPLT